MIGSDRTKAGALAGARITRGQRSTDLTRIFHDLDKIHDILPELVLMPHHL